MRSYLQIKLVATVAIAAFLVIAGVIWGDLIAVAIGLAAPALAYVAYRAYFDNE